MCIRDRATASGSCNTGELLEKGFAGCMFKPFSISELMEVSDRCAIKATPDGKPDFSALLSYGNEAILPNSNAPVPFRLLQTVEIQIGRAHV